jgi:hypothetical protein
MIIYLIIQGKRLIYLIVHSIFFLFSWVKVLYDFVMDDKVGPWARVTRPTKIGRVPVATQQEYEQQLKNAVNSGHKRG